MKEFTAKYQRRGLFNKRPLPFIRLKETDILHHQEFLRKILSVLKRLDSYH